MLLNDRSGTNHDATEQSIPNVWRAIRKVVLDKVSAY